MEYSFDVDIATKIGVNEAIFIKYLQFWIIKNKANDSHYHEGRTWTYNSYEALVKIFPFWNMRQIKYMINSLKKKEIILVKQFKKYTGDLTNWYTFVQHNIKKPLEKPLVKPLKLIKKLTNDPWDNFVPPWDNFVLWYLLFYTVKKNKQKSFGSREKRLFKEFTEKLKNGSENGNNIKDYPLEDHSTYILAFFSHKTGKRILPVPSNLKLISARLKDGFSEEEIRTVLMMKYLQWKDNALMAPYIRISTLCRASKFADYVSEIKERKK